jgi:isochorismate pyruvate lyase
MIVKLEVVEVEKMKCENLEQVRENIDRIDNEIIELIAERGTYVIQASAFKKTKTV